jgi:CRP-like cAMP-binding protein
MNELEGVYRYLKALVPDLEPGDLSVLAGQYQRESYPSRTIVFAEGDLYSKVTFVLQGLVKKSYLTHEGKEYIKEFTWEGQITTPYASLLLGEPASYTMETLEPTELLTIPYARIEELIRTRPRWTAIGKALADLHFLNREARERELLKNSAPERYAIFKKRFPELLTRLRKQDIACYLGITPVSLSRIESLSAGSTRRPGRSRS